ncbi:MAG: hypothetical protein ACXAEU_24690 [Candidatus Hodarchaeales archaeon]
MSQKHDRRGSSIEDMGQVFENWEIKLHSRNQFEILIDYLIDPDTPEARFKVELFFFIPKSFRINEETYTKQSFYQDMQAYIRFLPKVITLSNIINEDNRISPLTRANKLLEEVFQSELSNSLNDKIIHELKMLVNLTRTYVYREVQAICSSILSITISEQAINDSIRSSIALIQDIKSFNVVLKKTSNQYLSSKTPESIRDTFEFVSEFISLSFQRELTKLLNNVEFVSSTHVQFKEIINIIQQSIKNERDFRMQRNYPSVLSWGEDNETFSYRYSILKKYISNVLYLTARPVTKPRVIQEIGYAAAAGFAMLVALVIAYLSQEAFGSYTLPFITAMVIGYMIKDRLKEWGRSVTNIARKDKSDYESKIKDNLGNIIGYSKEFFKFIDYDSIPKDILQARGLSSLTAVEAEGRPQEVIRYAKNIGLLPKKISDTHERVLDTSDIIRFDISNFLSKIENPQEKRIWFNPETNNLEYFVISRAYHLNLILKFTSLDNNKSEECRIDRVRLILDKKGIKRIETKKTSRASMITGTYNTNVLD